MKKWLFAALYAFAFLPAQADEKSEALLGALTAQMSGYGSYEIPFAFSMQGAFQNMEGRLVVSGDRYYVRTADTEVFSDGKNRWVYHHEWKEVVLEKSGAGEVGFLDNPARFFTSLTKDFAHAYKGTAVFDGKTVDVVELTPRSGSDAQVVIIRLDSAHRPVSVTYKSGEGMEALDITVRTIMPDILVSDDLFTFDRRKHPDVEVVDFR